jgi:hypothetical protein
MVAMTSNRMLMARRAAKMILGTLLLSPILLSQAQDIMLPGDFTPRVKKRKPKPDVLPPAPGPAPSWAFPVSKLGFGTPSLTYLGRHYSLVSLDFLDEDRVLFSFRASGLLEREEGASSSARQMKAVVLRLPDGKVESQALWTIPDRERFLWPLKDGHFLLRDQEGLKIGDTSLQTRLLLTLTGQFRSLQIDPNEKVVVVHTIEHTATASPAEVLTRVIQIESGKVQQTTRSTGFDELPINSEGSLEVVHEKYDQWSLKMTALGGSKVFGHTESTCLPSSAFLSDREILIAGCDSVRVPKLTAVSAIGRSIWEAEAPLLYIPPLLIPSLDGSRFVRETIVLKRKPSSETLWVKAVKGQVARVFDSASGKIVLEMQISPVLDGGGNVAISPSGRRVAVLNAGSIQVFDLPPPPLVPLY